MKLPPQVRVSHFQPTPESVQPVIDREAFWKPYGGLWTSTWKDGTSEWTDWLLGEGYTDWSDKRWGGRLWLLEPHDANVYAIHGPDDLLKLRDRYPSPHAERVKKVGMFRILVDWVRMAKDYDGVWVPNPRPWRLGFHFPSLTKSLDEFPLEWSVSEAAKEEEMGISMFFYVMDAESTCWFRWCFEEPATEIDFSNVEKFMGR